MAEMRRLIFGSAHPGAGGRPEGISIDEAVQLRRRRKTWEAAEVPYRGVGAAMEGPRAEADWLCQCEYQRHRD